MTYIRNLKRLHDLIDAMFFDHQKALIHFEFEKALTLLETYEAVLLRHMQDEELTLLPVYAERAVVSGATFTTSRVMISEIRVSLDVL